MRSHINLNLFILLACIVAIAAPLTGVMADELEARVKPSGGNRPNAAHRNSLHAQSHGVVHTQNFKKHP